MAIFGIPEVIHGVIASIDDRIVAQALTLRFIHGLSWDQVAAHIGGGNTDKSVSLLCYRYLARIDENITIRNGIV